MRPIDADKLVAELQKKPIHDGHFIHTRDVSDAIFYAPTISPDEVRGVGEWEQKEIFGVEETTIEQMQSACCSVCGKYHTTPYSYYFSKYNYCPSCGARMKGVSEDANN